MNITSVESQKSSKGRSAYGRKRFNVFLDGEFAFGADEDLVVSRRLVVGKIIDPQDLDKILFEAEVGKLMEKMYRWFNLRQHSEKEVRDYFKIKNQKSKIKNEAPISDLVVDAVIEVLKKKSMVNDLEFAKAWTEARRRSKQKGIRAIKQELFQKGIGKEIVEEVTRVKSQESSEEDLAKLALEKKIKLWRNLDPQKFKKKAFEFLMRKGFEYEIIKSVVEKIFKKE